MFGLFLKKLTTDTSAEEISRIKSILELNNIKFKVIITQGKISTGSESHVTLDSIPVIHGLAPEQTFIYNVYVNLKAYARARELVSES